MLLPAPLPETVRPRTLDEFIGQTHIVGPDTPFRKLVDSGTLPSSLFWGPPGIGKTTLARILSRHFSDSPYFELSAVSASVRDVRAVISEGGILFLDEIHRFSKSQQDVLLPAVESGRVTLLGATTENPAFSINSALLSRARVLQFKPLDSEDVYTGLVRAIGILRKQYGIAISAEDSVLRQIASHAGGDLRGALLRLEDILVMAPRSDSGEIHISPEMLSKVLGQGTVKYDRDGDEHYDHASAFQKSLRGSDPDAAIYWMAKMLEGGEDPRFIARRLIVTASEDVGLADPMAMVLAENAFRAVEHIGMPEGRIILAQAVLYVATAPKSNSSKDAIDRAVRSIRSGHSYPVPMHLKDAHYKSASAWGRGQGYVYPHVPGSSRISYLPEELDGQHFYEPRSSWEHTRMRNLTHFLELHHDTGPTAVRKIREALSRADHPLTVKELADTTGLMESTVNAALNELRTRGELQVNTTVSLKQGKDSENKKHQ